MLDTQLNKCMHFNSVSVYWWENPRKSMNISARPCLFISSTRDLHHVTSIYDGIWESYVTHVSQSQQQHLCILCRLHAWTEDKIVALDWIHWNDHCASTFHPISFFYFEKMMLLRFMHGLMYPVIFLAQFQSSESKWSHFPTHFPTHHLCEWSLLYWLNDLVSQLIIYTPSN
jgi:hypothetical protein